MVMSVKIRTKVSTPLQFISRKAKKTILLSMIGGFVPVAAFAAQSSLQNFEVEGTIQSQSGQDCEALRKAFLHSGVEVDVDGYCIEQAVQGPQQVSYDFLFSVRRDLGLSHGVHVIPTATCQKLARALNSASFNDSDPSYDNAEGYCEPSAQDPSQSRLSIDFGRDARMEMMLTVTPDLKACETVSNALLDSGLSIELKPINCYQGNGYNSDVGARVDLYTLNSSAGQTLKAKAPIPAKECNDALSAITNPVVIYPGDMKTAISGKCSAAGNSGQAYLALTLDPYTGVDSPTVSNVQSKSGSLVTGTANVAPQSVSTGSTR